MRNLLFFLWIIILPIFVNSCKRGNQKTKEQSISSKKNIATITTYQYEFHTADSVNIDLIIGSENKVIGLKLSNGQQFNFSKDEQRLLEGFKLEMKDFNFDDYKDIRVLKEQGATGNNWYDTWIYRPSKKQWLKNDFLSKACGVEIDSLHKRIITQYWGGWADQSLSVYTASDTTFSIMEDWYVEGRSDTSMIYINYIKHHRVIKRDSIRSNMSLIDLYKKKTRIN